MRKYIKTYESFKDSQDVNEGWFGDALKSATGALKTFLSNFTAPFKTLVNDFKKGMKLGDLKTKISAAIDNSLKTATDSINTAKDEQEINSIKDSFNKEIDTKIKEFAAEASKIKESKIFEGAAQDALIGANVVFTMFKNAYDKKKAEFDKAFAAAKDLNGKKTAAINALKTTVADFKNSIKDDKTIEDLVKKYKDANNITDTGPGADGVTLDWGDIEIDFTKEGDSFKVTKSNSKKLLVGDTFKSTGTVKKGDKSTFTDITRGGKVVLPTYNTGNFEKILSGGKEIQEYTFEGGGNDEEELKTSLGNIKNDKDKMKKVLDFVKTLT